ncbi:FUSC family protein [Edwardsiella anguillarum]|uniref:FUSC family protein n=1 Tax=Edwardsiella anguillarum TaxID=1821960 RepID=UPI0024B80032|nr:FUSC family protein [Edwardsiella anguillarum]WHQ16013.1 FUSC family protein [Edwardsiella anguillarum]
MTRNGGLWQQLPWGKATAGQWRYALRNTLAMCLALWIAFALDLDEPYWAFTSAAVVSFPTVGGVIGKSIGRIIGSLLGALASMVIAGLCLNEPWLFTFCIAGWIALCTYVSNHYQNNLSYAFALAGYTAAIIAFTTPNSSDTMQIFDIAQARVCEVITGLLCGALMMMIMPNDSDGANLLTSLRRMHQRLLEHALMLWAPAPGSDLRTAHETVIREILTLNLLRIQAFWSHYHFRRNNHLLNYLLHQQLRMTSAIAIIRRMRQHWPDAPPALETVLTQIVDALRQPTCDPYRTARLLAPLYASPTSRVRLQAFVRQVQRFVRLYLGSFRWLQRLAQSGSESAALTPPSTPPLALHTDTLEAAYNALRTFCTLVLGCTFWIETQWDSGASALAIAAVTCVLYSASASPMSSLMTLFKAMIMLSVFCFLLKFGLMIQINDFWVFCLILAPILLTMQLLKLQSARHAALWGQVIVFMGSFLMVTNPPQYDYASVLNGSIAKIGGVLLAALAFQILHPSSDRRKGRRIIRAMRRDFIGQLAAHPRSSEAQYESLIYHRISQLNQSRDALARRWLLRWGMVLLNCTHIVWQLRNWEARGDPLERVRDLCLHGLHGIISEEGVQQAHLTHTLAQLARMSELLAAHPNPSARDLAGVIWRLYCALSQLQMAMD